MPRTRKLAGQAVDRRNGRRAEVAASSLAKFALPRRDPAYLPETRKAWLALWADGVLASVLMPVDRPVLIRWADALDRAQRHYALGDEDPIAPGHAGQPVESPHFSIGDRAMRVVEKCEAQLGVGALNRARLGIAILQERVSLADLNARIASRGDDDDDPR